MGIDPTNISRSQRISNEGVEGASKRFDNSKLVKDASDAEMKPPPGAPSTTKPDKTDVPGGSVVAGISHALSQGPATDLHVLQQISRGIAQSP